MRSFAMVASALGDRFRVRLRIAGDQAFTDGELVVLPQLPEGSEYTEAAWGYLVHEAAHLRFTDFELANRRCVEMPDLYRHVWNVFEDLRIEPALAALYPGVPRMINLLCDRALMIGASYGLRTIGADVVSESAAALGLRTTRARPGAWKDHFWRWAGLAAAVIALIAALLLFAPLSNPL